jgi:single-strand DNA-binding protein
MPINSVTLIGNLVEDPELRFTPSGVAMAKLRFAVNRRWQDRNGDWQEDTSFFGGTVWREMAESAAESLTKGTRVIVTGSLEQRSWETQEGEKRSVVEVRIDEIGPSLRWATAQVTKTARSGGDFQGGGQGGGGQGGGGQGRDIPPGPVGREDYGPDEAPF